MNCLDTNNKTFPHDYQNIMIVKELQVCSDEMYLGGKNPLLLMNSLLLKI